MILSRWSTSDSWYLLITNTLSADLTRVSLLTTAYNRQTDHVNPSTVAVGRVHIMHATSLAILKWHRAPRGLAATAKHNAGEEVRPWALCGQSYNFDQLHQPRDLLTVTSAAVLIRPSDFEWTLFQKIVNCRILYKSLYLCGCAFSAVPSVLWRCWLGGRKGIRPVKNWVVGWWRGSLWSDVQTCIWPSWCHCHSLSLASVKSRLVLPFWYRLTWVVPEKGPLHVCACVCTYWAITDMSMPFQRVTS